MVTCKKIIGIALGFAPIVYAVSVFATADQDVIDVATTTATTIKENMLAVLQAALPILLVVGVAVLSVFFAWRLGKRLIGGR